MRIEAVAGGPGHATSRCIVDARIIDVRITGAVVTCTRRRSTNQRESKSEQSVTAQQGSDHSGKWKAQSPPRRKPRETGPSSCLGFHFRCLNVCATADPPWLVCKKR